MPMSQSSYLAAEVLYVRLPKKTKFNHYVLMVYLPQVGQKTSPILKDVGARLVALRADEQNVASVVRQIQYTPNGCVVNIK